MLRIAERRSNRLPVSILRHESKLRGAASQEPDLTYPATAEDSEHLTYKNTTEIGFKCIKLHN
jgi:hypothetical protein